MKTLKQTIITGLAVAVLALPTTLLAEPKVEAPGLICRLLVAEVMRL